VKKPMIVELGLHSVEVNFEERSGGNFSFPDGERPTVSIGFGEELWADVLDTAIHEFMEFMLVARGLRFKSSGERSRTSDSTVMFMTHAQFTSSLQEATAAWCVVDTEAYKQWKAYKAKLKRRKKK